MSRKVQRLKKKIKIGLIAKMKLTTYKVALWRWPVDAAVLECSRFPWLALGRRPRPHEFFLVRAENTYERFRAGVAAITIFCIHHYRVPNARD